MSSLDHLPLFLDLKKVLFVPHPRKFRFENIWLREESIQSVVENCWCNNESLGLIEKIGICSKAITNWGCHIVIDFQGQIAANRTKIRGLKGKRDAVGLEEFRKVIAEYSKLLIRHHRVDTPVV